MPLYFVIMKNILQIILSFVYVFQGFEADESTDIDKRPRVGSDTSRTSEKTDKQDESGEPGIKLSILFLVTMG